jgi:hypothetical protein
MKREFLTGLTLPDGVKLDKATIDAIMAENGNDINALKAEHASAIQTVEQERDYYRTQLETAQTSLKGFEGVDVEQLKTKISELTSEIDASKTKYEAEIADIKFSNRLSSKATAFGARNVRAVVSLLNVDELKKSKNQETDIEAALKAVKESDGYMFASDDSSSGKEKEGKGAGNGEEQQNNPQFSNGNLNTGNGNQQQNNSGFNFGFLGVRPHDNK